MAQADSNISISTSVDSTRRRFLSQAAGAAVGVSATIISQPAFAAPRDSLDPLAASPALCNAVVSLRESSDRLQAAKAKFAADELRMDEWSELHTQPNPKNRRAQKKYWNRWRDVYGVTVDESWAALLAAHKDFQACQYAVAHTTPRDENDLVLKAAVAFTYDIEKGPYGRSVALISYSVAMDLFKLRMPAA